MPASFPPVPKVSRRQKRTVAENLPAWAALIVSTCIYLPAQAPQVRQTPTFRVGVETVVFRVTVTDPLDRHVVGLEKSDFHIYEDKVEQTIDWFSQEASPVSVGLILDMSSSMGTDRNIQKAKNAIVHFLEKGSEDDEYCLISFNERTNLVQRFTRRSATVRSEIATIEVGGRTALFDAVYLGLNEVQKAKNEKKALLLVTDGEDNSSRYTLSQVRELAKESDAQIYAIGQQGREGYGNGVIQSIVSLTGGRTFFPRTFNDLDYYIDLLHGELRSQYVLAYTPSNKMHDGKWRKIAVKIDPPAGLPKLIIHAKDGYYAPKN
jgi:Ca-activated chloride channel family protein